MRNYFASLATLFVLAFSPPLTAQDYPVVVELYTSQGCSSCPPADAILTKLAQRDDVIALALHVDYWDYIGWTDIFGDPAYSLRQRSYARAAGIRTVYTPQMIVGGVKPIIGSRPMEIVDEINNRSDMTSGIELVVARISGKLSISAEWTTGQTRPVLVQLVRYTPSSSVEITRGENAGLTIEYTNIVTEWREIKKWNGTNPLQMVINVKGPDPVVVIVQEDGPGEILAAAQLR